MKNPDVTMVNPRQIVGKGLKGCSSTRTVTAFAQKYGVPCVWWTPNRNQKVLLVDWPQFRSTWKQVWNSEFSTPSTVTRRTTDLQRTNRSRYTRTGSPTRTVNPRQHRRVA